LGTTVMRQGFRGRPWATMYVHRPKCRHRGVINKVPPKLDRTWPKSLTTSEKWRATPPTCIAQIGTYKILLVGQYPTENTHTLTRILKAWVDRSREILTFGLSPTHKRLRAPDVSSSLHRGNCRHLWQGHNIHKVCEKTEARLPVSVQARPRSRWKRPGRSQQPP